jgi:hypothetical protein
MLRNQSARRIGPFPGSPTSFSGISIEDGAATIAGLFFGESVFFGESTFFGGSAFFGESAAETQRGFVSKAAQANDRKIQAERLMAAWLE